MWTRYDIAQLAHVLLDPGTARIGPRGAMGNRNTRDPAGDNTVAASTKGRRRLHSPHLMAQCNERKGCRENWAQRGYFENHVKSKHPEQWLAFTDALRSTGCLEEFLNWDDLLKHIWDKHMSNSIDRFVRDPHHGSAMPSLRTSAVSRATVCHNTTHESPMGQLGRPSTEMNVARTSCSSVSGYDQRLPSTAFDDFGYTSRLHQQAICQTPPSYGAPIEPADRFAQNHMVRPHGTETWPGHTPYASHPCTNPSYNWAPSFLSADSTSLNPEALPEHVYTPDANANMHQPFSRA